MSILLAENSLRCDRKCYDAESPECNCVCGGANHGVGLNGATGQMTIFDRRHMLTLAQFYSNRKRKHSRQLDLGSEWRDGKDYPTYRVSWVEKTGEIYAIDEAFDGVEVIGIVKTEKQTKQKFKGWHKVCGRINSLEWVRRRVQV